jgi:hypothetical protein
MRMVLLGLMVSATCACSSAHGGGDPTDDDSAALTQCGAGETALYSKVTPPSAGEDGASGIADAPSVLSGNGSSGSTSGGASTPAPSAPFASTAASCVQAVCPSDQVAVPNLSATGTSGGGGEAIDPPASGAEGAPGGSEPSPPVSPPSPPVSSPPAGDGTSKPTTDPPSVSASDVLCVAPPPACAAGQAPSYAPAGFWHCMPVCDANDANLVVISYGGIYGNGGLCAGPPPQQACPIGGQVWTWSFLEENWGCAPEWNNGQYDQRTFEGQVVCVPC